MKGPANPSSRLHGLDSIRFLCALVVFCYHYPPPVEIGGQSKLEFIARGVLGNLWCGPAAVVVFFIISGFCIHHPYASSARWPSLREFYLRRFLRLLPPMAAAILIGRACGVTLGFMQVSVLWSLLAEFIYYLIYPFLLALRLRAGRWLWLVVVAYVAAFWLASTNPHAPNYPSFGAGLNWLLGLPCWLLGCGLAEAVNRRSAEAPGHSVWLWRGLIISCGMGCSILRFHASLGYPWTLNLFALPATGWLYYEIAHHRVVAPSRFLEWAGQWSYSLYLIHDPASALFLTLFSTSLAVPAIQWPLMACFVLATSCLFYLLIERPSHVLARNAGRWISSKS